jgi:two-component system cell cycle sensor histidine kinase/response regulator CckA
MQPQHREPPDPQDGKCPARVTRPTDRQFRHKLRALVVDDEHPLRNIVQLGLERHGFEVLVASSGREAIELYRAHRETISVVLLDVRMPRLDGAQTLDRLRELNPAVLACFMSGDTGAYSRDDLIGRGAACVIAKPFQLDELTHVLRRVAHGTPANLLPPVTIMEPSEPDQKALFTSEQPG